MWPMKLSLILPLVVTVCAQAQFGEYGWSNLHPTHQPQPLMMEKFSKADVEHCLKTLSSAQPQQPLQPQPEHTYPYPRPQSVQSKRQYPTIPKIDDMRLTVPIRPYPLRPINNSQISIVGSVNNPILPPVQTFEPNTAEMSPQNLPNNKPIITSQPNPSFRVPNEPSNIPGYEENYDCSNGNGFYPIPNSCDSYIKCEGQTGVRYSCPDGLHFNPAAKWLDYPCAYPSEVECPAGSDKQVAKPTDKCPRQYGFFSLQDGECSKYINCQEGKATIMDCPAGLVFNEDISSCDWLINVPGCNPNVFSGFQCPDPPSDLAGGLSENFYKYKYDDQCKQFVACQGGQPRLLSCASGLLFDEALQACVDEKYVTGCATPYSTSL